MWRSRGFVKDALSTCLTSSAGTAGGLPSPMPLPCISRCPTLLRTSRSSATAIYLKPNSACCVKPNSSQPSKEKIKRCVDDNVILDQLQESTDFIADHSEKQFHRTQSKRPFVTTGWYTMWTGITTRLTSPLRMLQLLCYISTSAWPFARQLGSLDGSKSTLAVPRSSGRRGMKIFEARSSNLLCHRTTGRLTRSS